MTIRRAPLAALNGHDLIPQAIIDRPVSRVAEILRASVDHARDDFDEYEGFAAFMGNNFLFAFKHYAGYPPDTTTIYLPIDMIKLDEIMGTIENILVELNIEWSDLSWDRSKNPDL